MGGAEEWDGVGFGLWTLGVLGAEDWELTSGFELWLSESGLFPVMRLRFGGGIWISGFDLASASGSVGCGNSSSESRGSGTNPGMSESPTSSNSSVSSQQSGSSKASGSSKQDTMGAARRGAQPDTVVRESSPASKLEPRHGSNRKHDHRRH